MLFFFVAFVGWEQANKYQITNNQNRQIYFAAEGKLYF